MNISLSLPARNLKKKKIEIPELGSVHMASSTVYSLRAMSLEHLPLWKPWAEGILQAWELRVGRGGEEPLTAQV